jgi:hypothetical protein
MSDAKVDHEGQVSEPSDVDAALEYLNHEEITVMTEIDEKKLVRKIDWWIVPLMCSFPSSSYPSCPEY